MREELKVHIPSNISHKTTANNQDRFLSVHAKLVHRVDYTEQGIHVLGLLANLSLMEHKTDAMMVKVTLHQRTIQFIHVEIHYSQTALPSLIALGQLRIGDVKDSVQEFEIILNLLISADREALLGGLDRSLEVRHVCDGGGVVEIIRGVMRV